MTDRLNWQARLKAAAEALERTPGAPEWLHWALRDAVTVAPDFRPRLQPDSAPPIFFYPH